MRVSESVVQRNRDHGCRASCSVWPKRVQVDWSEDALLCMDLTRYENLNLISTPKSPNAALLNWCRRQCQHQGHDVVTPQLIPSYEVYREADYESLHLQWHKCYVFKKSQFLTLFVPCPPQNTSARISFFCSD